MHRVLLVSMTAPGTRSWVGWVRVAGAAGVIDALVTWQTTGPQGSVSRDSAEDPASAGSSHFPSPGSPGRGALRERRPRRWRRMAPPAVGAAPEHGRPGRDDRRRRLRCRARGGRRSLAGPSGPARADRQERHLGARVLAPVLRAVRCERDDRAGHRPCSRPVPVGAVKLEAMSRVVVNVPSAVIGAVAAESTPPG